VIDVQMREAEAAHARDRAADLLGHRAVRRHLPAARERA